MTRMGTKGFVPDRGRRGGLWARDLDADAVPYLSQTLGRDTEPAEFVFAARGDGEKLSVIALGLTAGKVTSAIGTFELAVPSDYVAVYKVGLNAATAASPTATAMTQVELWGEPNAEACVQLVDYGGYHDERYPISYITTPNDADCDGLAAGSPEECDDHFYKGFVRPSTSTLSCLDHSDLAIPMGVVPACRVGGPICNDGTPASTHTACSVAHPYCAPTSLCERCPDTMFERPFEECAIDPTINDPDQVASAARCVLPTAQDATGVLKICAHSLRLATPYLLQAQPLVCANPMFHGPKADDVWRGRIDAGNGTYTLSPIVNAGATTCTITGTTTKLPDNPAAFPYGGLVSLDLTEGRGIVVPLVLELGVPMDGVCLSTPMVVPCKDPASNAIADVRACLEDAPISNP